MQGTATAAEAPETCRAWRVTTVTWDAATLADAVIRVVCAPSPLLRAASPDPHQFIVSKEFRRGRGHCASAPPGDQIRPRRGA
jgi:hypothetical protein